MTLAGNSLSFGGVRTDEFLRGPEENDSYQSHTVCVSQAKEARAVTQEHDQDADTVVENTLAALNEDDSTDLEETDVRQILSAHKESRQLRGEQRENRGYKPVTRRTSGGKPFRVEGRLNIK